MIANEEHRYEIHQALGHVDEFASDAERYARELPDGSPEQMSALMTLLSLRHLRSVVRALAFGGPL